MRNFTWNQFPIKNVLIDSLLTPIVESTYLNRDMCNHRKKTKADGSRLIPRKHTETLVLLSGMVLHFRYCQGALSKFWMHLSMYFLNGAECFYRKMLRLWLVWLVINYRMNRSRFFKWVFTWSHCFCTSFDFSYLRCKSLLLSGARFRPGVYNLRLR